MRRTVSWRGRWRRWRWPPNRPSPRKAGNRRLCGAGPRHQQLPASDRLSDQRRLSRGRFLLAHHPARRGRLGDRLHQRGRDRARHRRARICRDKINLRKAKRLRLIATEACRAASNAEGFRSRVAAETGIELEVIDRETEARSPCSAARRWSTREAGAPSCSTSAAARPSWCGSSAIRKIRSPRIKAWMSIPLGVVTLAEQFGGRDVTPEIYAAMVAGGRQPRRAVRGSDMAAISPTCICSARRAR